MIELDEDNTNLEYVKEVQMDGESNIIIHSQPGYGEDKTTYLVLDLVNTIAVRDCRNITSVTDKTWRDIEIRYFHPVKGPHKLKVTSPTGDVKHRVKELQADFCRVVFDEPIPAEIRIEVRKMSPVARQ